MTLRKLRSLASILRRDPKEFAVRVTAIAQGRIEPLRVQRPAYQPLRWAAALEALEPVFGKDFTRALSEPVLAALEAELGAHTAALQVRAPYTLAHNADADLARCCYAVCRVLRPATVIETGVGYGVTTSYLLAALAENGHGALHSIDLPPLDRGAEAYAGVLVPGRLRTRWGLHRGMSRHVLPRLLDELGSVDVFVHDSLHTYANMRFEFAGVWPRLAAGGVVLADDVEGNAAFAELSARDVHLACTVQQSGKQAMFGIAVKRGTEAHL